MTTDDSNFDISIDLPITCTNEITDDGVRCNAELTAADYIGMRHPTDDPYLPRHTGKFHAFSCSDCGGTHYVCPVCDGGSFDTEDSGTLICHNCRPEEAVRQDRDIRHRQRGYPGRADHSVTAHRF